MGQDTYTSSGISAYTHTFTFAEAKIFRDMGMTCCTVQWQSITMDTREEYDGHTKWGVVQIRNGLWYTRGQYMVPGQLYKRICRMLLGPDYMTMLVPGGNGNATTRYPTREVWIRNKKTADTILAMVAIGRE